MTHVEDDSVDSKLVQLMELLDTTGGALGRLIELGNAFLSEADISRGELIVKQLESSREDLLCELRRNVVQPNEFVGDKDV
ncbi:hypothetical protein V8073_004812 [Vibrio parahaemolyticus]|nr:hypothetical protein [Vibrio parahaemolyticus]EIT7132099.1 hypothetical protein [Vibrio parahaemolyticus]EIZ1368944.1 hypothetical protein [Vibrio parahaemolyticus]EIZ4252542.1 hypothetical protein [Vibrio parahaemolyticus]